MKMTTEAKYTINDKEVEKKYTDGSVSVYQDILDKGKLYFVNDNTGDVLFSQEITACLITGVNVKFIDVGHG